jgi:hypothetical protein
VNRSDVARPKSVLLPIRWRGVLKQFDFVSAGCFQDSERNLGARHAGDFSCEFTGLIHAMRELETKNITPESERSLKIRNGKAGVIGGNDAKRPTAH